MPGAPHSHRMLGMRLDYAEPQAYLARIMDRATSGQSGYCCIADVHQCVRVHDNPRFAAKVNGATLVIPDSVVLQRARALFHGVPYIETMRGADIMLELCRRAEAQGVPIALIGGRDDAALAQLQHRLMARFPALEIAYAVSPPFRPQSAREDTEMTGAIAASGARLVFVGLGCPKQENWMADHTGRIDAMMVGVGAAFDFNAGIVRLSPRWVHRAGLEWLHRLASEPRRLWKRYLCTAPRFLWLLARDAVKRRGRPA